MDAPNKGRAMPDAETAIARLPHRVAKRRHMMKLLVRILPLLAVLAMPVVAQGLHRDAAGHPYQENLSYGYATVLRVQPAYEQFATSDGPRCVERRRGNATGGTVLGAIVGGALGTQVGKGDGRRRGRGWRDRAPDRRAQRLDQLSVPERLCAAGTAHRRLRR
jgi:hypothetical protein